MPEYVRVKDPSTGHEHTVTTLQAEAFGCQVINKPAVDDWGNPLPAKPSVTVAEAAAAKKGA